MQFVNRRYRSWILALAIAAIFSGAAHAGDMAQVMPADTVIYVGWADWAKPDSAEMRFTERVLSKLRDIPELQGRGDEALARLLLDVIVPLQTGSVGVGLFNLELGDRDPVIEAALVADSGAGNERLMAAVQRFLQDVESSDEIRDRNVGGAALKSIAPPREDIAFFWGIYKGHFILTISEAAAEKVVACLNGTAPTLASSAEVKLARGKVHAHPDQTHFCVFVNVQPALGWVKKILAGEMGGIPPEMETVLEELGINSLKSKYVQIENIDGVPRMGAFAHIEGELKGIFSLWNQQPVTKDDLQYIPKDAYWAQVNNLNLAGVWAETLRVIDSANPDLVPQIQGGIAMSAQMLGFSITNDLLPALGDTWIFYDAPDNGGFVLTGTVLVVEAKDAEAVVGMLRRSVQVAIGLSAQADDFKLSQHQLTADGHPIDYLMVGGLPVPVAPAWSIVGDRLVVGLNPQTVAAALQQADPRTRNGSLLDNPAFTKGLQALPGGAIGVGYINTQHFVRCLYPFLTGLGIAGMSMLAPYGIELDLDLMPPLPKVLAETTNYVGVTHVDSDGILYESVGSGAPLGILAAGAVVGAGAAVPAMFTARANAQRAVAMSNLRNIGIGCMIYANDNQEKFPETLHQLVEGSFITEDMLYSRWQPGVLIEYVDGQSSSSADPRNVLAYDLNWDQNKVIAVFADGHTELLSIDEFKQHIRQTYERLGRVDEIPDRLR